MKKYILSVALCFFAFCLQSCFQDMDYPGFNYPESNDVMPETPLIMYLPFDGDDVRDKGEHGFIVADNGKGKFVEGLSGSAYQGNKDAYILANTPSLLKESLPNMGSCTVAFWMRAVKNTSAQGIFSIPNTKKFWGNFDIFLENNNSETQAFFKMRLMNQTQKKNDERWVEARIDNIFGDQWVHLAFVYDGQTSQIRIYRNGEQVFTKELPGCGALKFNDLSTTLAIGAFQFSTKPSLTTATGAQTWASNFPGQLDQFRLYNTAVAATDIQKLYAEKQ